MAAAAAVSSFPNSASAQGARIEIAAGTLPQAIEQLARQTGVSIGTEGALPHIATPRVHDAPSVAVALARLLAGSGYRARQVGPRAWRIERAPVVAPIRPTPPLHPRPAPAPPPEAPSETIIVTAAKRPIDLADLPLSVAVVAPPDARRANAASGTSIIAQRIEGLALTGQGPGRNRLFLHGIADSPFGGASQSTVAVQLDDARVTYSAPDPDIRLIDMARVEVLKGPQGSLYGTGALGGIYRLVTHRAELDRASFQTSAGLTAVTEGGVGYTASGVVNLPLARDVAGLRLVGYSGTEPGWVDTGPRRDSNRTRVLGARAGLGIAPGGGWRADLTGMAQWITSRDSQYVYAEDSRRRPTQLPEPHDNDLRHLALQLAREHAGGIDIVLSSGATWHEVGDTFDATIGAGAFGLADPQRLAHERAYRLWDSELRLSGKTGGLAWLAGVSHVEARQRVTTSLEGGGQLPLDHDRRNATDTALFGTLTLPLLPRVTGTIGARLFRSSSEERRERLGLSFTRHPVRTGITPDVSLSWKPGGRSLLWLRRGTAFRQGGSTVKASGALEALDGDELTTIEAGWRQHFASGARAELGAWHTNWSEVQSDMLQGNGLIETRNVGDARIAGIELSLSAPLARGWSIEAGGNWTSALLTRNATGIALHDRHLPVVPEFTLRGALGHRMALGSGEGDLRLQMRYVGPARLSFDPALDRPMGKTLDAAIEATGHWHGFDLSLTIDNLLNAREDTFAYGNPLRFAASRQFTPQAPRSVTLTIGRAW